MGPVLLGSLLVPVVQFAQWHQLDLMGQLVQGYPEDL
jgi:hypothetical protein